MVAGRPIPTFDGPRCSPKQRLLGLPGCPGDHHHQGQRSRCHHDSNQQLTVCEFSETPEQIKSEIKISRLSNFRTAKDVQLSIREILNYMRLHPDLNPRDRAVLQTKLQERLAAPWTCFVVILIALPFAAQSSRRHTFVGVASSVFICFGFFILLRFGLALGTGGYVPAWLGALAAEHPLCGRWDLDGLARALGRNRS